MDIKIKIGNLVNTRQMKFAKCSTIQNGRFCAQLWAILMSFIPIKFILVALTFYTINILNSTYLFYTKFSQLKKTF